ncbi:MAG: hypothetical protein M1826_000628 [Phylliscum demangeonii]|nr:MAG: hypothetical protein M1826_000628 [Phylliscum demangeonii]
MGGRPYPAGWGRSPNAIIGTGVDGVERVLGRRMPSPTCGGSDPALTNAYPWGHAAAWAATRCEPCGSPPKGEGGPGRPTAGRDASAAAVLATAASSTVLVWCFRCRAKDVRQTKVRWQSAFSLDIDAGRNEQGHVA